MGKLMVVSGAGRGFGRACAEAFSAQGWDVVAVVRSARGLEPFDGGITVVEHTVTADPDGVFREALGGRGVDLLVNNAAQGAPRGGVRDVDPDLLLASLDTNVAGPLRLVQELLPSLLLAPAPLIINVSSRLGSVSRQAAGRYVHLGTSYAYRVSKAAQNMLTISLANELGASVRCWAVHPGQLATAMGVPGASKLPATAAVELLALVESGDPAPLRFCSLGGADLEW